MGTSRKISLFFNFIFIIILALIVLYIGFSFTKVLFINMFDDTNQVVNKTEISELSECITKYYDYLYYGQFEKAKHSTAIVSRKSNEEYLKMQNEILSYGEYEVVIRYAYKLFGSTYRCYVTTFDKSDPKAYEYILNEDKTKMNKIVISLDRINDKFSIIYEEYYNINM